jgi:hypothetical protein
MKEDDLLLPLDLVVDDDQRRGVAYVAEVVP